MAKGLETQSDISDGGTTDWRCPRCAKLLGRWRADRLHLRHGRNHEYIVSLPATATCRGCGTLSELTGTP